MKEIIIDDEKVSFVDDEDYEFLTDLYYFYLDANDYVICKIKDKYKYISMGLYNNIHLHKLLMMPDKTGRSINVDHRDGNKLNNQKSNLRICTHQENMMNSKRRKNKQGSKYKGVFWNKRDKVYYVQISLNEEDIYLGLFDDEVAGANCYNHYAKKYHGEFALLNDVPFMSKEEWLSKKRGIEKTSKYRGVSLINNKWTAQIWDGKKKKNIRIGEYDNEIDAAKAYNKKAIEIKGNNAKLNKIN